jgi:tetratricopeptide (TPR) repeat protein
MFFNAKITVEPSFSNYHYWYLTLENGMVRVEGRTCKASAITEKLLAEYDEDSRSIFNTIYTVDDQGWDWGCDGMTVRYDIKSSASDCRTTIWQPQDYTDDFPFTALLKFCWFALYGQNQAYDNCLELLLSWDIPIIRTGSKLRIFEMQSAEELERVFSELDGVRDAIIQISNFQDTENILQPILMNFAQRNPDSIWLTDRSKTRGVLDKAGINYGVVNDPVCFLLAETDVYLAYGRYQQAEEIMLEAIENDPEDDDFKRKLLQIFCASNNISRFEEYLSQLITAKEITDIDFWREIAEIGETIIPNSPLLENIKSISSSV